MHLILKVVPTFKKKELDIPIRDTGIDSLDLLVIRVEIEKYFGLETTDSEWYQFKTLAEALAYFENASLKILQKTRLTKQIKATRRHEIRIPQMAINALSENWLLKELGDIHWCLLSKGLRKKSSEFKDYDGNRLYATFIRINISISPLNLFHENDTIKLNSTIKRFGSNTYCSKVLGESDGNHLEANLITSFTQREENDNLKMSKSTVAESHNPVQLFENIPDFLSQYKLLKKNLLEELKFSDIKFHLSDEIISSNDYSLNPYYDINGVGLLYFASYPIIADKCMADYLRATNQIKDFESTYHTIYRDIFYFSNCNTNDYVHFNLNSLKNLDNGKLIITNSLYRGSDKKIMAKIFTIKQNKFS